MKAAGASANLRGAGLMSLSMAGFAVEDLFLKKAAASLPIGQIMVIMGFSGAVFFALLAFRAGEAALPRAFFCRPMLIRSVLEISGRLFYSLAIALTPMVGVVAILQATPLMVVAGAAMFFGEKVGWRRWSAVGFGFLGVLVVLRPGLDGFSVLSLLALAGMLGFAGRDLATRAAPRTLSNRQLGTAGFTMLGIAGLIVLGFSEGARLPDLREAGLILGATVFGVAGYHALTAAMRTGELVAVAPFRYTRLLFALILAVLLLGERPDTMTLAGSAMIVGSGLYALIRARRAQS